MTTQAASHPDRAQPRRGDLRGAVCLLADSTPRVAAAARDWLLQCGEAARAALAAAFECGDVALRLRARALLRELDVRRTLRRFTALDLERASPRRAAPLLEGAVLLSQMVRTFAPGAEELRAWLRREAELLRRRFRGRSLPTQVRLLADRLHGELGLRGPEGATALDQVLVDRVLAGGAGAPETLSLVYLMAGRRAGLSMAGVALPGHFLVRIHGPRPVLVDPARNGRTLTKADCLRYLRRNGHDRAQRHLHDISDRAVLAGYLRRLRRASTGSLGRDAHRTLGHALSALEGP